ncbi:hypothetical protein HOY82DRAFT_607535 [Tuber indicum]|nr:hypothetical protein HOY82DRAFT_607535 [Tuber indicum]
MGDNGDDDEDEEVGATVMAGERLRRGQVDDEAADVVPMKRKIKSRGLKGLRMPIRMMAGREKFDFVGAFWDAPVIGLNWALLFNPALSVKKEISELQVQERVKGLQRAKGKGKGKKVTIDLEAGETHPEQERLAVAIDRDLGEVANCYTKGTVRTVKGLYRISSMLVEADSVVNLIPIDLWELIGAKLPIKGGLVIRTACNGGSLWKDGS